MNLLFAVASVANIAPAVYAWKVSQVAQGNAKKFLRGLVFLHIVNILMLAFWTFNTLSSAETVVFSEAFLGAQVALLAATLAIALGQQRLLWLLLAYIISAPLVVTDPTVGFLILGITSSIIIIVFAVFAYIQGENKIFAYGILTALGILVTAVFGRNPIILALTMAFTSTSLAFLYLSTKKRLTRLLPETKKHHGIGRSIAKFAVLVPLLTIFLLGVTVAVHEFSHAFAASIIGCEYSQAILYEHGAGGNPHATVQCEEVSDRAIVALAGTIVPILVALMFVFIEQEFTTILALYVAGFAFVFFYGDAKLMGLSMTSIFLSTVLGFTFLIFGIIKLSLFFLKEQNK